MKNEHMAVNPAVEKGIATANNSLRRLPHTPVLLPMRQTVA